MKKGWETKKLDDVCDVQRGLTYSGKDAVDFSSNVVLRATNICLKTSKIDLTELKYLRDDFEVKESYRLKLGSLLVCFSSGSKTHLGKIALVDREYDASFGGFIGQITPNDHIAPKYLFYNLISESYRNYISRLTDGVNINNLKAKDLKNFPIPIPPLPEQEKIVEILDKAFAAIDQAKANIEQNIANAKELFQSKLNQIFSQKGEGWVEKQLGEVCENLDSRRIPITKNKRTEGPIPYYGASGIVDYVADHIFDEDLLLVSEDGANLLARTYPIAFSISGKTWVNNHAHVLRFREMTSQVFIEHYLNSIKLDEYISGMAQPKLNQKKLNSIKVPFPDLEKQKEINTVIVGLDNSLKKVCSIYQTKLASLDELKKSILQKAFAGELT